LIYSIPDPATATEISRDEIPSILIRLCALQAALAARLADVPAPAAQSGNGLVDAGAIAKLLNVPVSKIHTGERAGKIPSTRIGRYVRFDPIAVQAAYARPGRI